MCFEDQHTTMINTMESFSAALNKCSIGSTIKATLRRAQAEKRLTVGLLPSIQRLSMTCGEALFCFMAPSHKDAAIHMQEVLLEAFCYENDIYIINVDSADKLCDLITGYSPRECGCILVHLPYLDPYVDQTTPIGIEHLSAPDKLLVEHCENLRDAVHVPVIRLPEK